MSPDLLASSLHHQARSPSRKPEMLCKLVTNSAMHYLLEQLSERFHSIISQLILIILFNVKLHVYLGLWLFRIIIIYYTDVYVMSIRLLLPPPDTV